MNFRFKLYRGLNAVNLFISGFFLVLAFLSLLMGSMVQGLIALVLLGAVFIHCILSISLQRDLAENTFTLKENTPGGLRIMGVIAMVYGGMMIISCISLLMDKELWMSEVIKQLPEDQQKQGTTMISSMITVLMSMLAIYGAMIISNCLLSFSFLKEWIRRQEEDPIL